MYAHCSLLTLFIAHRGLSYSIEICISKAVIQCLTFFIENIYSVFSGVLKMASIQIQYSSAFRTIHISRLEPNVTTNDTKEKKVSVRKK